MAQLPGLQGSSIGRDLLARPFRSGFTLLVNKTLVPERVIMPQEYNNRGIVATIMERG